jgi:hypothetical protein
MTIFFTILFVFNLVNPENIQFMKQTLHNNATYDCAFKYKGISPAQNRPAITVYGFTAFHQVCQ